MNQEKNIQYLQMIFAQTCFIRKYILLTALLCKLSSTWSQQHNKPNTINQTPVSTGQVSARPSDYTPDVKVNYVRVWEAMAAYQSAGDLLSADYLHVKQSTQYVDGLGRPLQTVMRQASPGSSPKDIVSPVVYDEFGREVFKYLPYVQNNNTTNDGSFKVTAFTDQDYFYKNVYKDATNNLMYAGEQALYERVEFEASPLNRIRRTFAPGNSWAGSYGSTAEKAVSQKYMVNSATDDVRIWEILNHPITYLNNDVSTNIPSTSNSFPTGQLYKNVVIDEQGNAVVEYKDKGGRVVLKKVQIGNIASDFSGYTGFLSTYYIYDDFGQLRFVIPPKAVEAIRHTWTFSSDVINELCFRYEYDGRHRMIAKKVPGAGWVYLIYDERDRLVFTQDANIRANDQWMTTLYDQLNRPVISGMTVYTGSPSAFQNAVSVQTATPANPNTGITVDLVLSGNNSGTHQALRSVSMVSEFQTTGEFVAEVVGGITGADGETTIIEGQEINRNPIPAGAGFIALTISYYDNYEWTGKTYTTAWNGNLDAGSNLDAETLPSQASATVKGMVTGAKARIIENPANLAAGAWLTTVSFYDDKARPVQVQADNHKGGSDIMTNRYDFSGKILTTYLVHTVSGKPELRVKTNMEYDHAGHVLEIWKTINDDAGKKTLIAKNSYDELGQLLTKQLGRKKDESGNYLTAPLETLDYNYNIRGWMKGINLYYANKHNSEQTDRWFGMELNYDWGFASNQFNGNISGTKWRSKGDGERRAYGFTYDKVNRLMGAKFSQYGDVDYETDGQVNFDMQMGNGSDASSAYDENGNIKVMKQWGLKLSGSEVIDELAYNYYDNSNKLKNVIDAKNDPMTKLGDFRTSSLHPNQAKNSQTVDYTYDVNGNLKKDLNKDIGNATTEGIIYNHLNLPWQITVRNASGVKGTITYIYDATGNKLRKVTNESEGRLVHDGQDYISQIITTTDYLGGMVYETKEYGNTRLSGISHTDQLQFLSHEEGRIRALHKNPEDKDQITSFEYDYIVKDHLGNVRMVLTEEQQKDVYPIASMEDITMDFANKYYNIDQSKIVTASTIIGLTDYENNNGITGNPPDPVVEQRKSQKLYGLNGGVNKTGLGMTLKVMSGDVIDIFGKSYYFQNNSGSAANSKVPVIDILNGLLGGPTGAIASGTHGGVTGSQLYGLSGTTNGINELLNDQTTDNNLDDHIPKAYINYLFFDEQFKCVGKGFSKLGANSVVKDHHAELDNIIAPRNGFVYIYVSNESPVDVFFDNLQVVHTRGALLEETHYYPFGLTMGGISSKALNGAAENKRKYQNYEFSSDFDLNLYESFFRTHDPQLGRFWQIDPKPYYPESPYVAMGNNPIKNFDVLGDELGGTDRESAKRQEEIIKNSAKGKDGDAFRSLIKLKKDGMTFKNISQKKLDKAISQITNADEKSLAQGYAKAINSKDQMFVRVVNKGENPDIENKKMSKDWSTNPGSAANVIGRHIDEKNGGGVTQFLNGQSLSVIVMNSTFETTYENKSTGETVKGISSAGETAAHEILGHALGKFNNSPTYQNQDAIRMSNLYRRSTGDNILFRTGAVHPPDNIRMTSDEANHIPDFLK